MRTGLRALPSLWAGGYAPWPCRHGLLRSHDSTLAWRHGGRKVTGRAKKFHGLHLFHLKYHLPPSLSLSEATGLQNLSKSSSQRWQRWDEARHPVCLSFPSSRLFSPIRRDADTSFPFLSHPFHWWSTALAGCRVEPRPRCSALKQESNPMRTLTKCGINWRKAAARFWRKPRSVGISVNMSAWTVFSWSELAEVMQTGVISRQRLHNTQILRLLMASRRGWKHHQHSIIICNTGQFQCSAQYSFKQYLMQINFQVCWEADNVPGYIASPAGVPILK